MTRDRRVKVLRATLRKAMATPYPGERRVLLESIERLSTAWGINLVAEPPEDHEMIEIRITAKNRTVAHHHAAGCVSRQFPIVIGTPRPCSGPGNEESINRDMVFIGKRQYVSAAVLKYHEVLKAIRKSIKLFLATFNSHIKGGMKGWMLDSFCRGFVDGLCARQAEDQEGKEYRERVNRSVELFHDYLAGRRPAVAENAMVIHQRSAIDQARDFAQKKYPGIFNDSSPDNRPHHHESWRIGFCIGARVTPKPSREKNTAQKHNETTHQQTTSGYRIGRRKRRSGPSHDTPDPREHPANR